MQNINQNIEYLQETNYSAEIPNSQHIKKIKLLIFLFILLIIIILLLLCYFINGMTKEIRELTTQIQHYNYHTYGCCQFYN